MHIRERPAWWVTSRKIDTINQMRYIRLSGAGSEMNGLRSHQDPGHGCLAAIKPLTTTLLLDPDYARFVSQLPDRFLIKSALIHAP